MFARMPPFKPIGKLEETYPTDHGSTDDCSTEEKPKTYIRHDGNPFQLVIEPSLNAGDYEHSAVGVTLCLPSRRGRPARHVGDNCFNHERCKYPIEGQSLRQHIGHNKKEYLDCPSVDGWNPSGSKSYPRFRNFVKSQSGVSCKRYFTT